MNEQEQAELGLEEVGKYLVKYRPELLTDAERLAEKRLALLAGAEILDRRPDLLLPPEVKAVVTQQTARHGGLSRRLVEADPTMSKPEVLALAECGEAALYTRIAERVLREHGEKVLHRCPKCGGLCRTPKAKQCFRCGHSWRE